MLGVAFLQTFSLSLGVGASTLAVLNYIVASADGVVDDAEQRLMGIVYKVLRVAMVTIFVTALIQTTHALITVGPSFAGPLLGFLYMLILILFVNAFFMTKHVMPRAIGPSLQVTSWYALAILNFLVYVGLNYFSFTQYAGGYLLLLVIVMIAVNGSLALYRVRV